MSKLLQTLVSVKSELVAGILIHICSNHSLEIRKLAVATVLLALFLWPSAIIDNCGFIFLDCGLY